MIGLVIVTLVLWWWYRDHPIDNELDKEFLKALPQAGIVTVAGALLTWLSSVADHRRADISAKVARLDLKAYDECMADVNDAQLELETVRDEVEESPEAYPSAAEICRHLKAMDDYLDPIVSEYEGARPKARGQPDIELSKIGSFSDFIANASGSRFKKHYSLHHRKIREAIRRDILTLASGRKAKETERADSVKPVAGGPAKAGECRLNSSR
jgi:hypothetical protein